MRKGGLPITTVGTKPPRSNRVITLTHSVTESQVASL